MICNYLIDIVIKNVNIMLLAVILDNGKGSRKLEIKIDHAVNNLFYFTTFWTCLQNKIDKKETQSPCQPKQNLIFMSSLMLV